MAVKTMNKSHQLVEQLLILSDHYTHHYQDNGHSMMTIVEALNDNVILSHPLFNIKITTYDGNPWNINQCSLFDFLKAHTDWQPLTQSFWAYIDQHPQGILKPIIINTDFVDKADKQHFIDFINK